MEALKLLYITITFGQKIGTHLLVALQVYIPSIPASINLAIMYMLTAVVPQKYSMKSNSLFVHSIKFRHKRWIAGSILYYGRGSSLG